MEFCPLCKIISFPGIILCLREITGEKVLFGLQQQRIRFLVCRLDPGGISFRGLAYRDLPCQWKEQNKEDHPDMGIEVIHSILKFNPKRKLNPYWGL